MSTRAGRRLALADAATARLAGSSGQTAGTVMSAHLLSTYAWSDRTATSRNTQWHTWVAFCESEQRVLLPVSEAHLVAFIGWLASERVAGRRHVSSRSIPQYLSAVRTMQTLALGTPVPSFPFVWHVIRAYRRWEEHHYPAPEVRCGVSASLLQQIWGLGMKTSSVSLLRDAALCVFAYCLNGLRESSVVSLPAANVNLTESFVVARLSVVKGQPASQVQTVRYDRLGPLLSPLDLWHRWHIARGSHDRFFALPGEQVAWTSGLMTRCLRNCLNALGVSDPPFAKYSSHSLRIGAHTEQVLLGIPLEVRLSRFGWGPRSGEMAATYFDRTIQISSASLWLFGPSPPLSASSVSRPLV